MPRDAVECGVSPLTTTSLCLLTLAMHSCLSTPPPFHSSRGRLANGCSAALRIGRPSTQSERVIAARRRTQTLRAAHGPSLAVLPTASNRTSAAPRPATGHEPAAHAQRHDAGSPGLLQAHGGGPKEARPAAQAQAKVRPPIRSRRRAGHQRPLRSWSRRLAPGDAAREGKSTGR